MVTCKPQLESYLADLVAVRLQNDLVTDISGLEVYLVDSQNMSEYHSERSTASRSPRVLPVSQALISSSVASAY